MSIVGYVRVSGLSQVTDGEGLAVQREKIEAWCRYQGFAFDPASNIEEDAAISGASTDNRPAFKRAVRRALSDAPGSTLVVYKLDRLGRNAIDVQETLAVLLDGGVRVVSIADGIDSASGMGSALLKLLTSILATFAELERETIRTRLLDGRMRAKANRRVYSRDAEYGLRREENGTLANDDNELRAIARIRELRAEGLPLRTIGARLLAEGLRPRRASAWSVSVLFRLATGQRQVGAVKRSERIERARAAFLEGGAGR
jgi:DNA invertase Pin-like site-specific DNA recombinase